MKTIKLKKELKETFDQLGFYKTQQPDQEIQIAYLTMKAKYLMEQISSARIAEELLS